MHADPDSAGSVPLAAAGGRAEPLSYERRPQAHPARRVTSRGAAWVDGDDADMFVAASRAVRIQWGRVGIDFLIVVAMIVLFTFTVLPWLVAAVGAVACWLLIPCFKRYCMHGAAAERAGLPRETSPLRGDGRRSARSEGGGLWARVFELDTAQLFSMVWPAAAEAPLALWVMQARGWLGVPPSDIHSAFIMLPLAALLLFALRRQATGQVKAQKAEVEVLEEHLM